MVPGGARTAPRPRWRWLVSTALVLSCALLTACAENAPQDTLEPQGPIARQIDNLIRPVGVVAGVVFVLVQGLVIYFTIRYRHREGRPEPVQVHGNTRLELIWTLIPAVILLAIAVPTIRTVFDLADKPENALHVTVIGHQFWFEYRYDELGIVTANELHMPVGRMMEFTLRGDPDDVIHSFWIPPLGGKTDIVPGRDNYMKLIADKPGVYLGQCAEYCGLSHANMRLRAVAQPQDEFDAWVQNQRRMPPEPPPNTDAAAGRLLFNAKGCGGCHTVEGLSKGTVGPSLTHLQTRDTFAGSMFDNTAPNLARWLRDPPGVKPGSLMPNLNLSADEINKLVAYMETLR